VHQLQLQSLQLRQGPGKLRAFLRLQIEVGKDAGLGKGLDRRHLSAKAIVERPLLAQSGRSDGRLPGRCDG
jgi:hypothetical protein